MTPPSVEENRDFVTGAAGSAMAQLEDVAQRIRLDLNNGTDVRPLLSQATSVVGSLRGVNPSASDAAQWQSRLSLLDSTLAMATEHAMQGNGDALRAVTDEFSMHVASTSMWVQSLRG
ncbi:hypothetical protein [uncultured Microbacterium sp.]|uniref:hypothetical protein n=1 Tax=uncultured Microbacterium sp. TaxID=191216 RepID=UPI00260665EE|nr:hypothetical protein [uncultured Microbacterium sp.]